MGTRTTWIAGEGVDYTYLPGLPNLVKMVDGMSSRMLTVSVRLARSRAPGTRHSGNSLSCGPPIRISGRTHDARR